jgi:hypothetical protein
MGKFVSKPGDMPAGQHYVILRFSTVYIPGDERSRTNPGHGYPEHSETTVTYEAINNRAEWEMEIQRLTITKTPFSAFVANPATIQTNVSVSVDV